MPEVGHAPGMRLAGQPAGADIPAEPVELLVGDTTLEVGPGVHAGGGVALDEDLVAVAAVGLAVEEVVEAALVEGGGRGVRRQVPAEAVVAAVGPGDHGHGVPADEGPDAALDVLVAGEPRL